MDEEQAKSDDHSSSDQLAKEDRAASPWDNLAEELGAEPSPEALEHPRQEKSPPHHAPSIPEDHGLDSPPKLPKAPTAQEISPKLGPSDSGDWEGLAKSLGITDTRELPDSQETAISQELKGDSPQTSGSQETIDSTSPEPSSPTHVNVPNEDDTIPNSHSPSPSVQGSADPQEDDVPLEPWGNRSMFSEEEQSQIAFAEDLDTPTVPHDGTDASDPQGQDSEQQGLSGKVAQSVFDALFLSGSTAAEALGHMFSLKGSDSEEPDGSSSQHQVASDQETESSHEDETDEQLKTKSRRRRPRRRRGRGRGVATRETDGPATSQESEKSSATEPIHQDTAVAGDQGIDTSRDVRNQRDSSKSERYSEPIDVPEHDAQGEMETDSEEHSNKNSGSPSKRPSHRNIPSWQEAMSVIVDSNIDARKKSPSPSGRSGAPRSRSRGGRRRKKT